MKFVEPIRSQQKLNEIKELLKSNGKIKDLLLIEHGVNSALRISDLLTLKVWDMYEVDWSIKEYYEIKQAKTWKTTKVDIVWNVINTLKLYAETYPHIVSNKNHYMFFHSKSNTKGDKPISRQQARKIITRVCEVVWLKGRYWGHTLRKTRWTLARKKGITLAIIQEKLNHSSLSVTKRYLGITDDEVREASLALNL